MTFDEYLKNKLVNKCDFQKEHEISAEWVMTLDDFENGWGERIYPHCSNCGRGVYVHDAGSWCPFCGKLMKNPMR